MGANSKIEWTGRTWNPLAGCEWASEGCDNCYAARDAVGRLSSHELYAGLAVRTPDGGARFTGEIRTAPERLDQPCRWTKPSLVFVNSMSDLFHPGVPTEFIANVFAVMALTPRHTYQVLTKRPQRMAALTNDPEFVTLVHDLARVNATARRRHSGAVTLPGSTLDGDLWPLPNVWLGTSIEEDRYVFRANALRAAEAAVRFISAEPLLGPLPSLDLTGIDWVIVGGESGPNARPMHPDWARDLRDRCAPCPDCWGDGVIGVERPHSGGDVAEVPVQCRCLGDRPGVAFLFKQWGEWSPNHYLASGERVMLGAGMIGRDPTVMVRVGKAAAGRMLDGRTWDEYPPAKAVSA